MVVSGSVIPRGAHPATSGRLAVAVWGRSLRDASPGATSEPPLFLGSSRGSLCVSSAFGNGGVFAVDPAVPVCVNEQEARRGRRWDPSCEPECQMTPPVRRKPGSKKIRADGSSKPLCRVNLGQKSELSAHQMAPPGQPRTKPLRVTTLSLSAGRCNFSPSKLRVLEHGLRFRTE